jgi:two-component system, NtrC family, sensor kinase
MDLISGVFVDKSISKNPRIRYHRLWIFSIIIMCLVSLTPLIIMTFTNYYQYEEAYTVEFTHQMTQLISSTKQTLEFFIRERLSALTFLINEKSFEDLSNNKKLIHLLSHLKNSFEGFIDLGLIDSQGNHRSYAGPYELLRKNYKDQPWFQEVTLQGIYVSDVFMGFRKFPHIVIAIKHETENGDFYVLRATLSTDILNNKIHSLIYWPQSDAFLINSEGILQTTSRFYGSILEKYPLAVPPFAPNTIVKQEYDAEGNTNVFGYAYIDKSPFVLIVTKQGVDFMANLFKVRKKLMWFLGISIIIIMIVIVGSTAYMVRLLRKSELKREKVLHDMEYTNKMASIGRLAAGVAHEINNPLAIINEKAGLVKDFATLKPDFNYKEKIIGSIDSIIKSVDRCSTITHRLLGFAKRMDINMEVIDLELLFKEVVGFLERDASLRNIKINFNIEENLPSINSDRGQLQQVFLNILTNAYYASKEGDQIDISANQINDQTLEIIVSDNGTGISEENLEHIFEPFYTTKGRYGTGLGLSITYGIVEKLGGKISVKSKLGKGTSFTVHLPLKSKIV